MSNFKATVDFDALMHHYRVLSDGPETSYLEFLGSVQQFFSKFRGVEQELSRLQEELLNAKAEIHNLQQKLRSARHLIDVEKMQRAAVEKEKMNVELQIKKVVDMLGQGNIGEIRDWLQILSSTLNGLGVDAPRLSHHEILSPSHYLSTINEDIDTMGSIRNVSEIDLTEGEELEVSKMQQFRLSSSSSSSHNASGQKRKLSQSQPGNISGSRKTAKTYNENKENCEMNFLELDLEKAVVEDQPNAYTTTAPPHSTDENYDVDESVRTLQSAPCDSPIRDRPQIQVYNSKGGVLLSSKSPLVRQFSAGAANPRQHFFITKNIYWTDHCQPCEKRIKFGKSALKCRDCRATCHVDCKDAVPLPCVPAISNPVAKGPQFGTIADYAPRVAPMVPALVVYCTNEVESRGLAEVGIYRVPGSDREIKDLRDRFLKGKGFPNLSGLDIHVVCGTLKVFLRSLKEPLIPSSQWRNFIAAAEKAEQQDALDVLYQAISELPQPNRDTLAWIICHLQRVAECDECKMPSSNLARVFGPTLIGYSAPDLQPHNMMNETKIQQKVMELMFEISWNYWQAFITIPEDAPTASPNKNSPPQNSRRRSLLSFTPLTSLDLNTPRRGSRK